LAAATRGRPGRHELFERRAGLKTLVAGALLGDGRDAALVVVVAGIDQGIVGLAVERVVNGAVEGAGIAALEISPAAAVVSSVSPVNSIGGAFCSI
jgi:hypothetical protein